MLPNEGGKHFVKKKCLKIGRMGCVTHERHKESNRLHTKFKKLQVLCIPSCLQAELGGEKCTGVEPEAVFEGCQERTHSEPNEQQGDMSEQKY